jgi:integrase
MASMSLRKRKYRQRRGHRLARVATWTIRFRDCSGRARELTAFRDKAASLELERRVQRLLVHSAAGLVDPETCRWLETLPERIARQLVKFQILQRFQQVKPLPQHLEDWRDVLLDKGDTQFHADVIHRRASRIAGACGFNSYRQISGSAVLGFLGQLRQGTAQRRGISNQTFNFYLQAIRQFCRWMVNDRRATDNPLTGTTGLNVRLDRRHDRRALTEEEARALLEATRGGPVRAGLDGGARALAYQLAMETGLRERELLSLTPSSIQGTIVAVEAAYSKHRRADRLPLRPAMAAAMQQYSSGLPAGSHLFPISKYQARRMLQADLKAAGIPYRDEAGKYADWHALRHSFISFLVEADVHPRVAQLLARHSTITLTMDRYSHVLREREIDAIGRLPALDAPAVPAALTAG